MSNQEFDLVITGDIVLSDRIALNTSVAVRDGLIAGLFDAAEQPPAKATDDARGCLVFPGIVDNHVHAFSNPDEGFETCTAAALRGGVTTMVEMPYDKAGAINTPERFQDKLERLERHALMDVAMLATLPKHATPDMVEPLLALGACGFKMSVYETDPERFPRIDDDVLWSVLPKLAEHGITTGFHAEIDTIIEALVADAAKAGATSALDHCRTRPPASETIALLKLLEMAHWTGLPLHLYHVSHPRGVELADWYIEHGADVSVETCPHYLLLAQEDMERLGGRGKINPPLRPREDVERLWQAVMDGRVDILASDHAPWHLHQKENADIFANASGAPGVETLFALLFSEGVVNRNLDPVHLGLMLATNPAQRFGLWPRKGEIMLGAEADFAIIDPARVWTVDGAQGASVAKWSPYDGMEVTGGVRRTWQRGRLVHEDGEILASPGDGRYVPGI